MTVFHIVLTAIFIPLFAFLYRCRGGFLGTGHTQLGRLIYWAVPVALALIFADPLLAGLAGIAAFLGLLIPHAEFQGDDSLESVLGMGGIGFVRLMLIMLPMGWHHPLFILIAPLGALSGAGYYIGWKYLNGIDSGISTAGFTFLGITFAPGKFAVAGNEWGEVLTGAAFGLAFALAV